MNESKININKILDISSQVSEIKIKSYSPVKKSELLSSLSNAESNVKQIHIGLSEDDLFINSDRNFYFFANYLNGAQNRLGFVLDAAGTFRPYADDSLDLGSEDYRFSNIYTKNLFIEGVDFLPQDPNLFLASPAEGYEPGRPQFRHIDPLDIPGLDTEKLTSGILPIERGGIGVDTAEESQILIGTFEPDPEPEPTPPEPEPEYLKSKSKSKLKNLTNSVSLRWRNGTSLPNGNSVSLRWRTLTQKDLPNLNTNILTEGILPIERGGSGLAVVKKHLFFAGNTIGLPDDTTPPSWRNIIEDDLPKIDLSSKVHSILSINNGGIGTNIVESHTILLGPLTNEPSAPTWRLLSEADLPDLSTGKLKYGILTTERGGTGIDIVNKNTVFIGHLSDDNKAPGFRLLDPLDIPSLDTNKLTSGILPTERGGSGKSLVNHAQVFIGHISEDNNSPVWRKIEKSDLPEIEESDLPSIDLTTKVYNILPISNGGSGINKILKSHILIGTLTSTSEDLEEPTWRLLSEVDLPDLSTDKLKFGILGTERGGTGVAIIPKNLFFAGDINTDDSIPAWRLIDPLDIPNLSTNKLTSGILPITRGGTGVVEVNQSEILLGSTESVLAAPTWRKLVELDLPNISTDKLTSGILPITRGGTGLNTVNHAYVFIGHTTTDDTAPTWRNLIQSDLPELNTNILTSGILPIDRGGIGVSRVYKNKFFAGPINGEIDILYEPEFRNIDPLDIPNLSTDKLTSGILPITRGGIGISSTNIPNLIFASAASGSLLTPPSFRLLTEDDIPELDFSKIVTGYIDIIHGGTGLTTVLEGQILIAESDNVYITKDTTKTFRELISTTLSPDNIWYGHPTTAGLVNETILTPFIRTKLLSKTGIAKDKIWYSNDTDLLTETSISAFGRNIINAGTAAINKILYTSAENTLGYLTVNDFGKSVLGSSTIPSNKILYTSAENTLSYLDSTEFGRTLLNKTITKDTIWYGSDTNILAETGITALGRSLINKTITVDKIWYSSAANTLTETGITVLGRNLINKTIAKDKIWYASDTNTLTETGITALGRSIINKTIAKDKIWYASDTDTLAETGITVLGRNLINKTISAENAILISKKDTSNNILFEELALSALGKSVLTSTIGAGRIWYVSATDTLSSILVSATSKLILETALGTNEMFYGTAGNTISKLTSTVFGRTILSSAESDKTVANLWAAKAGGLSTAIKLWNVDFDGTTSITGTPTFPQILILGKTADDILLGNGTYLSKSGLLTNPYKPVTAIPLIIETVGYSESTGGLMINRAATGIPAALVMGTEPGNASNPVTTNTRVWLFNTGIETTNSSLNIFRTNSTDKTNGLTLAGAEGAIYAETKGGFKKTGSTDTSVLLAGGGTKLLSDFVQKVHNNYIAITTGTACDNYNEGIRINRQFNTGRATLTLGSSEGTTFGTDSHTWAITVQTTTYQGDGALNFTINGNTGVAATGMTLTKTGILQVKSIEILKSISDNKNIFNKSERVERIDLFNLINSKINKKEFDEFKNIQLDEISNTMYKKEIQLLEQHKILIKQNKDELLKENENLINKTIHEKDNQINILIKENNILKDKINMMMNENKQDVKKNEIDLESKYMELEGKLNELYNRFNSYL
ncbi:hypothetical protein EZS27_013087 [termite gut metagenome]|uniref:Uncharacterized protein n=1 Tax=termite gut metagenome TaxID=433724 RepID=A0A5J4S0F1_9ZZZZ